MSGLIRSKFGNAFRQSAAGELWLPQSAPGTDLSDVLQAYADQSSLKGPEIRAMPGVYAANVVAKPYMKLRGAGYQKTLIRSAGRGNPGAVIGSARMGSTAGATHPLDPHRVHISDLAIDGGADKGPTDCGIMLIQSQETPNTNNPVGYGQGPVPVWTFASTYGQTPDWDSNDAQHILERIAIFNCGGPVGLWLGRNMRNSWVDKILIYHCRQHALVSDATDSQFSNIQAGACGAGVLMLGPNSHWFNIKSWYHVGNVWAAGSNYVGNGNGFDVQCYRNTGVNMVSQDNGNGFVYFYAMGNVFRAAQSSGDVTAVQFQTNAEDNELDLIIVYGDRQKTSNGIIITDASAKNNAVRLRDANDDPSTLRAANFKLLSTSGTGSFAQNEVVGYSGEAVAASSSPGSGATVNPDAKVARTFQYTLTGPLTVGPVTDARPGQELEIIFTQDATGDRAVTWDASFQSPPFVLGGPNQVTVTRWRNVNLIGGATWQNITPLQQEAPRVVGAAGQPGYQNAWVADGTRNLYFYADTAGKIRFGGNGGKSGAANTAMFTLPVNYRPSGNTAYEQVLLSGGANSYYQIGTGGVVTPVSATQALGVDNVGFLAGH